MSKEGSLLIIANNSLEYLQLSGTVKLPLCIASVLSPNGRVKKHSLYNKQPRA